MPEFVKRGAADLATAARIGAGVVDQVASGAFGDLAFAKINHAVEGHVLARLAVKEEVAGLGAIQVAGDEMRVAELQGFGDRKSTRLNSSHLGISYAVFCL